MSRYNRRDILRMGAALAGAAGLGPAGQQVFADGVDRIVSNQVKVLWLPAMSCSGCSVSFLNAEAPGPLEILTEVISLVYHPTVGAAQGDDCWKVIDQVANEAEFLLVFEGAVPLDMPEACVIGGQPLATLLPPLLKKAKGIISAGTCAAFGGICRAEGNPTGASGLKEFMEQCGVPWRGRLINCPGCPVHPQSLVGTMAYVLAKGYPQVDPDLLSPDMFYKHSVHDECPRFHYWEKGEFAERFGDEGCLLKIGCLGPLSHSNCPRCQWNGGVNWCIRAGAPCIACTSEEFAHKRDFPFYRKGEEVHAVAYVENDRKGSQS